MYYNTYSQINNIHELISKNISLMAFNNDLSKGIRSNYSEVNKEPIENNDITFYNLSNNSYDKDSLLKEDILLDVMYKLLPNIKKNYFKKLDLELNLIIWSDLQVLKDTLINLDKNETYSIPIFKELDFKEILEFCKNNSKILPRLVQNIFL
ncbi:MAG: hypothetical protein IPO06_13965 [Leptospiraceae bacterium]|nr:hypothetical protein [Leptospiraceae bacterium]